MSKVSSTPVALSVSWMAKESDGPVPGSHIMHSIATSLSPDESSHLSSSVYQAVKGGKILSTEYSYYKPTYSERMDVALLRDSFVEGKIASLPSKPFPEGLGDPPVTPGHAAIAYTTWSKTGYETRLVEAKFETMPKSMRNLVDLAKWYDQKLPFDGEYDDLQPPDDPEPGEPNEPPPPPEKQP